MHHLNNFVNMPNIFENSTWILLRPEAAVFMSRLNDY